MVLGKADGTSSASKELPLFIPPRKRQSTKKCTGNPNYVDHIVNVQGRSTTSAAASSTAKQSPTSPCGLQLPVGDALLQSSSLLLKKSHDNLASASAAIRCDLNAIRPLAKSNENTLHELHQFGGGGGGVATPSSCYSAESSLLDAKSNSGQRSHDCLTGGGGSQQQQRSASKKRVNYRPEPQRSCTPQSNVTVLMGDATYDDLLLASGETTTTSSSALTPAATASSAASSATANRQLSFSRYTNTIGGEHRRQSRGDHEHSSYLTMTGTVKRGRKKGQSVDLQLNMSREELEQIQAAALVAVEETARAAAVGCCQCTATVGVHVLLLSLLSLPFVLVATGVYSFYIGTLTWYNAFNYYTEERSLWLRLLVSPVLVLLYPVLIVLCTLGLAVYAGLVQLSVRFSSWANEIGDVEKGFYGWLCSVLRMSDCSPYEVVVLVDLQRPEAEAGAGGGAGGGGGRCGSSTEELSL